MQRNIDMKTMALLCLQHWKIDELLAELQDEPRAERRVEQIVAVVEHLTAHLAVKKNVLYPAVDDAHASALVASWHGNAAARRGLMLLVRAVYDDELCRFRARALRMALEAYAQHDESLVSSLESSLSQTDADRLGHDAERFYDACMRARHDSLAPPSMAVAS